MTELTEETRKKILKAEFMDFAKQQDHLDWKNNQSLKENLVKTFQLLKEQKIPLNPSFFVLQLSGFNSLKIIYTIQFYHYCFKKVYKDKFLLNCESFTQGEIEKFHEAGGTGYPINHLISGKEALHTVKNIQTIACSMINTDTGVYLRPEIYSHLELFIRWNKIKLSRDSFLGKADHQTGITQDQEDSIIQFYSGEKRRLTDYPEMLKKIAIKHYIKGCVAAAAEENDTYRNFQKSLELDEEIVVR